MIVERRESATGAEATPAQAPVNPQQGMNLNRKKLLFRFIGLPHHTKVAIMKRFGLWQEDDQKLPDAEIIVVHRTDGSGTTFVWTDFLAKVSPEWKSKVGAAKSVSWPVYISSSSQLTR